MNDWQQLLDAHGLAVWQTVCRTLGDAAEGAEDCFQERKTVIRPAKLESEYHGHQHGKHCHDNGRYQKLLADHFMILAEHIFSPERVMMLVLVCIMGLYCVFVRMI